MRGEGMLAPRARSMHTLLKLASILIAATQASLTHGMACDDFAAIKQRFDEDKAFQIQHTAFPLPVLNTSICESYGVPRTDSPQGVVPIEWCKIPPIEKEQAKNGVMMARALRERMKSGKRS